MPNALWSTDRLIMRGVEDADDAFLQRMRSDAVSRQNQTQEWPAPPGSRDAKAEREWLQGNPMAAVICLRADATAAEGTSDRSSDDNVATATADAATGTPIGYITLSGDGPRHRHHRFAQIALGIAAPYQRRGYGTEALKWCLRWGFHHAGLRRIEIGAYEYNAVALRLYERLGFVHEGRRREIVFHRGRWWDVIELAMLEREWVALYGKEEGDARADEGEM